MEGQEEEIVTFEEIIKDKDFWGLPDPEKVKVLADVDSDFKGLPAGEQLKVLATLTRGGERSEGVPPWGQRNPNLYGVAGAAYETFSPVIDALGIGGGALVGAGITKNPLGAMSGAGLGYSISEQIKQRAGEALGVRHPQSTPEAFHQAGKDVLVGGLLEGASGVAAKGVEKLLAPFAKTITPEAREIANLARQEGVDLTAAEVTGNAVLAKIENLFAWLPGSGGIIQRSRMKQMKSLIDLRERLLNKIADGQPVPESIERVGVQIKSRIDDLVHSRGEMSAEALDHMRNELLRRIGSTESYETLGLQTRELVTKRSQDFFAGMNTLYTDLSKEIPAELNVHAANNLQRTAMNLLKQELRGAGSLRDQKTMGILIDLAGIDAKTARTLQALPARQVDSVLDQLAQYPKQYDWATLQAERSKLSALIRKTDAAYATKEPLAKGMATPESGIYKTLKKAINQDIGEFGGKIAETNPNFKYNLALYDAIYREGKTLFNSREIQGILRANPERVLDTLYRPGRITELRRLRQVVGDKNFEETSKGFASRLFKEATSGGEFSWQRLGKVLDDYGDPMLREAIPEDSLARLRAYVIRGGMAEGTPQVDKFLLDVMKQSTPETVMNIIFHPNNTRNIATVRDTIGKEAWAQAKEKFTEKLLAMNEFGMFRPIPSVKAVGKFDAPTLRTIYTPTELKALGQFSDMARTTQGAERIAGNPSGTGQAWMTFTEGKTLIQNPITGAIHWLTPAALARLYLSPMGRQLLSVGLKSPSAEGVANTTVKILGIVGNKAVSIDPDESP